MRLFIALHFSAEIEEMLLEAIRQLREQATGGNFTRRENLHLTLAFIGESGRAAEIIQAMDRAPGQAFSLTVGGGGRFGDLYWVGVEQNPALAALAAALRQELAQAGLDFDRKPFKPHITIARQVAAAAPPRLEIPRLAMTVSRIALMKSERAGGRLVYTEVYAKALS